MYRNTDQYFNLISLKCIINMSIDYLYYKLLTTDCFTGCSFKSEFTFSKITQILHNLDVYRVFG